jgi:hypothetical protein
MGMLGELFPGRKILDESGEDADGKKIAEPWQIDLDGGVVRLRGAGTPKPEQEPEPSAPDGS